MAETACLCTVLIAASHHVQAAAYYLGMLAYYWVLATPAVGFLFGCYLYVSVGWFEVHYDEAFSALRIPHFKGFSRIHIDGNGDVRIYGLAMDKVRSPTQSLGGDACPWPGSLVRAT